MAVGKVRESVEAPGIKRFIGASLNKVVACNPSMSERNTILGIDSDKEPIYTGTRNLDGVDYPQAIVTVYVQPNYVVGNDNNGEEIKPVIPVSFFITKRYRYNSDKTKIQVIDNYGYSGWATQAELENHTPLLSKNNKPLRITTSYRPAYEGEIEFVEFVKNYLNIDEAMSYINEEWTANPKVQDVEECEVHYNIDKFFNGDFSEIKSDLKLMPENEFKAAFGVRTDDKGNMYQMMYTRVTSRKSATGYRDIDASIADVKKNGGMKNVDIDTKPFREHVVTATNMSTAPVTSAPAMPFGPTVSGMPGAAPIPSTKKTPWG